MRLSQIHLTDCGISLFGLKWDEALPPVAVWKECFRVLRPGGFLLAFGHVRAYHRLVCQVEDIGFIVKDCLCWGYATGNPRQRGTDKAIDQKMGLDINNGEFPYEPKSDEAKPWKGYADRLKPCWEPIITVQKPLEGSYVDNVLKYKVGLLNIDECRIPYMGESDKKSMESFLHFEGAENGDARYFSANTGGAKQVNIHPDGRYPGNLMFLDPLFADYDRFFIVPKPIGSEKGEYNEHDTVKPVRLMERLIKLFTPKPSAIKEDVIVLDPFMGSGTTAIACRNLGRHFIGFEKDEQSYKTALRRINDSKHKPFDMFDR